MNLTILAADIARRIPAMAQDSVVNNESLLFRLLNAERERCQPTMQAFCSWCKCDMGVRECLPEQAGGLTHGICEHCERKMMEEI